LGRPAARSLLQRSDQVQFATGSEQRLRLVRREAQLIPGECGQALIGGVPRGIRPRLGATGDDQVDALRNFVKRG
jgi:hypothetical protein